MNVLDMIAIKDDCEFSHYARLRSREYYFMSVNHRRHGYARLGHLAHTISDELSALADAIEYYGADALRVTNMANRIVAHQSEMNSMINKCLNARVHKETLQ